VGAVVREAVGDKTGGDGVLVGMGSAVLLAVAVSVGDGEGVVEGSRANGVLSGGSV
jgi:hypothetical protein